MKRSQIASVRYAIWYVAASFFCVCWCGCFSSNREKEPVSSDEKTVPMKPDVAVAPSPVLSSNPESSLHSGRPTIKTEGVPPQFKDISRQAGIRFQAFNDEVPNRYFLPEVMGAGLAWLDFDQDGWLDLFVANGCSLDGPVDGSHQCQFFRSSFGQSFANVTAESRSGCVLYGQGCAVGDFDSDGFADLFIGGFGSDILLKNNGDGTFQDVTTLAEVSDPRWSSSSFWADIDGDELLDLFVVNYVNVSLQNHRVCNFGTARGYCGPGSFEAQQDCVYRNLGDGRFEEVATRWGLNADNGKGLAVVAADFDLDLVPEIYVGNDMTANFLFVKEAAPTSTGSLYREIAAESGCAVSGVGMNEASMGVAAADFNCDGLPDLFLTHYYHAKNTLYRNLGNRMFEDDSYRTKVAANSTESLGFGVVVLDYNRDGSPDLFVANGHVLGPEQQPQKMKSQLLQNVRGIFTDVSRLAGDYFQILGIARSAAAADYDNDGDIDIAISHVGSPLVLLRNDLILTDRPFIGLKLLTVNRIPPIGGRVICRINGRESIYPIVAGGSYLAAADDRLILAGWKDSEGEPEIEIHWPSGHVDRFNRLVKNQYFLVREGAELITP